MIGSIVLFGQICRLSLSGGSRGGARRLRVKWLQGVLCSTEGGKNKWFLCLWGCGLHEEELNPLLPFLLATLSI